MEIMYEGLFLDDKSKNLLRQYDTNKLERKIEDIHITFRMHPQIIKDIVGHEFLIKVIGYGHNENNTGFSVELDDELLGYYENYATPHITTSVSKTGKAKDTKFLHFEPLEEPLILVATYGYFIKDEEKYFVYKNKQNKTLEKNKKM